MIPRGKVGIARAAVDGDYTANGCTKNGPVEGPGHEGSVWRQGVYHAGVAVLGYGTRTSELRS
jgi:hypothetical protein